MSALLQISDPHFGTEQPAAVDALVRLVAQLRPRLVVLSGDITQRATAVQFAAAQAFTARLAPVPVLAIPGNHDIPLFALCTRLIRPYARYEAAFGVAADREFVDRHWHVVALNTTRPWRHKQGEVSAQQVAFAAARVRAAAPGAIKVVVTHQPVAVTQARDRVNLVRGHAAAIRAWQTAGADLILGGHIHLPFLVPLHGAGAGVSSGAGSENAGRPLWAVQAGTAVSTRIRRGTLNCVTELSTAPVRSALGQRVCMLRFWEWAGAGCEFEPCPAITLPLGPRPGGRHG